jgi:hypothetical protein
MLYISSVFSKISKKHRNCNEFKRPLGSKYIKFAEILIWAFFHLGYCSKGEQIKEDLEVVGYSIKPIDPFEKYIPNLDSFKSVSPYAARVRLMWRDMRDDVESIMPIIPDSSLSFDIE